MQGTLSALRELETAGIDSMHAEAIVGVVAKGRKEFAAKADLKATATALEARLEARIERAMNRNLLATIAVGGIVIAAIKLL